MVVFIDDSGDPGFEISKGSSPYFIIAMVIFDDELEAEKTSLSIKELRRKLKVSDQFEFKFNKTNRRFRNTFIGIIQPFNFRIRAIVVDKNKIRSTALRQNKEKFYNYIIMQVLKNHNGTLHNAKLKFDGRGERVLRNELRAYLSRELNNRQNSIFRSLKFVDSKQNTLIQLADMAAGSIFSHYSGKDSRYFGQFTDHGKIQDVWTFQ